MNNVYEIKFNDASNKESVLIIKNDTDNIFNKNLFKMISYKGNISRIGNNFLEKSIDNIVKDISSQGFRIISVIILNWELQGN